MGKTKRVLSLLLFKVNCYFTEYLVTLTSFIAAATNRFLNCNICINFDAVNRDEVLPEL